MYILKSVLYPLNIGSYANRPSEFFLNVQSNTLHFFEMMEKLMEKLTVWVKCTFKRMSGVRMHIFKMYGAKVHMVYNTINPFISRDGNRPCQVRPRSK